jgi:hypothetical protein
VVTKQDRVNGATFSPDGRWVAYYTEDVDGPQAYVMPFPTGQRIRLSTTSGYWPQWSQDGRHIKERFLLPVSALQRSPSAPLTVVLNWMADLGKR